MQTKWFGEKFSKKICIIQFNLHQILSRMVLPIWVPVRHKYLKHSRIIFRYDLLVYATTWTQDYHITTIRLRIWCTLNCIIQIFFEKKFRKSLCLQSTIIFDRKNYRNFAEENPEIVYGRENNLASYPCLEKFWYFWFGLDFSGNNELEPRSTWNDKFIGSRMSSAKTIDYFGR